MSRYSFECSPYGGEDDPEYEGDPECGDEEDEWDGEGEYPDDDDYLIDGVGFADPGGNSALRAATPDNPRNLPCPQCGGENLLTPIDRQRGYVCDSCADANEGGGY